METCEKRNNVINKINDELIERECRALMTEFNSLSAIANSVCNKHSPNLFRFNGNVFEMEEYDMDGEELFYVSLYSNQRIFVETTDRYSADCAVVGVSLTTIGYIRTDFCYQTSLPVALKRGWVSQWPTGYWQKDGESDASFTLRVISKRKNN